MFSARMGSLGRVAYLYASQLALPQSRPGRRRARGQRRHRLGGHFSNPLSFGRHSRRREFTQSQIRIIRRHAIRRLGLRLGSGMGNYPPGRNRGRSGHCGQRRRGVDEVQSCRRLIPTRKKTPIGLVVRWGRQHAASPGPRVRPQLHPANLQVVRLPQLVRGRGRHMRGNGTTWAITHIRAAIMVFLMA